MTILRTKSLDDLSSIVFALSNTMKNLRAMATSNDKSAKEDSIDIKAVAGEIETNVGIVKEMLNKVRAYFLKKLMR